MNNRNNNHLYNTNTKQKITPDANAQVTRVKTHDQPCWTCQFATGCTKPHKKSPNDNGLYTCPWATQHKPVPGWTAKSTQLKVSPTIITPSYDIMECPYYTPDLSGIIEAMPLSKVAKLLRLTENFVKRRITASRYVLYQYAKAFDKLKEEKRDKITGATNKPTPQETYALKIRILKDTIEMINWELSESEEGTEDCIKDERRMLKGCQDILRTYELQYKREQKRRETEKAELRTAPTTATEND